MEAVRGTAIQFGPTVRIAGWSAYPRIVDFAAFRAIADEVGAHLWVDMAHFVGLVAACLHPSPVPHADLVSTTVHKTFGGARSGLALGRQQFAKAVNSAVSPGRQGGPAMQVVAAKPVTFKVAATPEFAERQRRHGPDASGRCADAARPGRSPGPSHSSARLPVWARRISENV
jgi:glycine hydroxymethyltransferase